LAEEASIDPKGRILIPIKIRKALRLHEGSKVRLKLIGEKIIITRPLTPEEFISEMEGFVKEGSPIPEVNPLKLKRIWEKA